MQRLSGKTAIITGAGRGIGRDIAHLFAQEGARVVVADNGSTLGGSGGSSNVADRVVEEIRRAGGQAIADDSDVADWKSAERLVDRAIATWGKLDILVNVAGNIRAATITDITEDDFDSVIRVHLKGTFNTSHFAAKHWVSRKDFGRLINCSSRAGISDHHPTLLSYTSAKAGIIGFTAACANALVAYGVTANVLVPNAETRMTKATNPSAAANEEGMNSAGAADGGGAIHNAAHVAPMAVFLATEQAGHITGRVFGAYKGRYTLWSKPREEREVNLDWPHDYEKMFAEFDRVLGANLRLEDLTIPLGSLEGNWRQFGPRPPRWDFKTKP